MKDRAPNSIEGSITRVKDILGAEKCGEILDISRSMVWRTCDAEHADKLTVKRAIALDAACRLEAGEMPIHDFYSRELEKIADGSQVSETDLARNVLMINAADGDLSKVVAHIEALHERNQNKALSEHERISVLRQMELIRRGLMNLEKLLAYKSRGVA
jgi:hypothetical protein